MPLSSRIWKAAVWVLPIGAPASSCSDTLRSACAPGWTSGRGVVLERANRYSPPVCTSWKVGSQGQLPLFRSRQVLVKVSPGVLFVPSGMGRDDPPRGSRRGVRGGGVGVSVGGGGEVGVGVVR